MLRFAPLVMALALVGASVVGPAAAHPNDNARIALHLLPVQPGNACGNGAARPGCGGVVTAGLTQPTEYFAYVLVMQGDPGTGIAGLQFGIDYDGAANQGVDIFYWRQCATLEFPMPGWPNDGTGNLITWDASQRCQRTEPDGVGTGVVAVVGYFYLGAYTPDVLRITPRPADGKAKVADCTAVESLLEGGGVHHDPSFLGFASFSADGSVPGYNPCGAYVPPPIDCAVTGPASVASNTAGHVYSADAAPSGASFAWAVTGSGSIVGSAAGRSIEVQTGGGPSFMVQVTVTSAGASSTCSRTISVTPSESCLISGPGSVLEGSVQNTYAYSATGGIETARLWSITGSGTLATSATQPSVWVTAGASGQFDLTLTVTFQGGASTTCTRSVTVLPATCAIEGPAAVPEQSTLVAYSAGTPTPGATYAWSVTGNGAIFGPTHFSTVVLNCGAAGGIELTLTITRSGVPMSCMKAITLTPRDSCGAGRQGAAKILLHLDGRTAKNPCGRAAATPSCANYVTRGRLYPELYYAYLLVAEADAVAGVAGLECGIDYDGAAGTGVDIYSWSLCATLQTATNGWPNAGGGNRIRWDSSTLCQRNEPGGAGTGVIAVAGYFYVGAYAPDLLRVTIHPVSGAARVADCDLCESIVAPLPAGASHLGSVRFSASGTEDGYNPCGASAVPVLPVTWSAIKALYGKETRSGRDTPH